MPPKVTAPVEYWECLKREFGKESEGYDADEDEGYFLEWLVERLWVAEGRPCQKQ